jgi:O-methyltransferase
MVRSLSTLAVKTWRSVLKRASRRTALQHRMRDIASQDLAILYEVDGLTMVGPERLYAFIEAVRHVVKCGIPGAIVECGVWRGGATITAIRALQSVGETRRQIYLYDTFEGMNAPSVFDVKHSGEPASLKFQELRIDPDRSNWCRAELDGVRQVVLATGYPRERIHFIKGKVEDTLPAHAPEEIAVLRLDTDWYESTRWELVHLFPRLVSGGVLLLDDYGYWQGARRAVDEYLAAHQSNLFLARCDDTGRVGVKP